MPVIYKRRQKVDSLGIPSKSMASLKDHTNDKGICLGERINVGKWTTWIFRVRMWSL